MPYDEEAMIETARLARGTVFGKECIRLGALLRHSDAEKRLSIVASGEELWIVSFH